ncbi:MAG: hypothetical protein ACREX8_13955 [Gammaproteobacteria bacterium]
MAAFDGPIGVVLAILVATQRCTKSPENLVGALLLTPPHAIVGDLWLPDGTRQTLTDLVIGGQPDD